MTYLIKIKKKQVFLPSKTWYFTVEAMYLREADLKGCKIANEMSNFLHRFYVNNVICLGEGGVTTMSLGVK